MKRGKNVLKILAISKFCGKNYKEWLYYLRGETECSVSFETKKLQPTVADFHTSQDKIKPALDRVFESS